MKKQAAPTKKNQPAKPKQAKAPVNSSVWSKPWFHIAVILVITFVVYLPALQNDWTNWDDFGYVIENSFVQHFTMSDIPQAFKEKQVMGNYHPLSMISLGIDHIMYGNDAKGYHRTAVIIHLLNTLLLFWFIFMLLNNVWAASIAALLFAVHPMHVESVAWISERKDLLYVGFFFAAAITWMKYLKATSAKYVWYAATIILFLCSLVSKGQAVTFPVLLVLIDLLIRKRINLKIIVEKIPFFALSLTFGIVAIKAQQASEAIQFIPFYSLADRLLFASYALFSYIFKFFLPVTLSAFHPYPLKNGQPYSTLIYASPVALLVIVAAVIIFFRKLRIAWLGIGFFMANIILVLQLLPVGNAIYAERYTYLAYTGLLIILGYVVANVFFKDKKYAAYSKPAAGFLIVLCIFFFVTTQARIKVWSNSKVLWKDVLSKYNYAPNAYNNLGSYYQKNSQLDSAMYCFTRGIQLQADFPEALINRSDIYRVTNKLDSAVADCNRAIALKPDYEGGYMNRGIALSIAGKYDDALRDFNKAAQLAPYDVKPYSNRANLLALRGDFVNSLKDYSTALSIDPKNNEAYSNRAYTYLKMKKYNEALNDISTAIALKSDEPNYYSVRCDVRTALGDFAGALNDAKYAQQLGAKINPELIPSLQQKVK